MIKTIALLYSMLTPAQRGQFHWLQCLIAAVAVVQVAGIVSIAPYVALLSNPDLIQRNPLIHGLYTSLGFTSTVDFLTAMAAALVISILISNALGALCVWRITQFSMSVGQTLQRDVYRYHLTKEYALHAQKNSAGLVAQISHESPRLAYMVLIPTLTLSSQVFVILLIAGTLLYLNWVAALAAVALIGGGYVIVYTFTQRALLTLGEVVSRTNRERQKQLNESIIGIKEVKLLGKESLYEERMSRINAAGLQATAAIAMFGDIPRYVLETIALAALLGLATYVLRTEGATAEIVGMMSLYAMAAYKLLPAAQGLFKCISQIRANGDVVHTLHEPVMAGREIDAALAASLDSASMHGPVSLSGPIELQDISYTYPGASVATLEHVSFTIPQNSLVALVGSSGAGKSTIADIILGLLRPNSGVLRVGDTIISPKNVRAWQYQIGYVPQSIFIIDDTVAANIGFGVTALNRAAVVRAAEHAEIDSFIGSLPGGYEFQVGERGGLLSGGQRQRLGIARALYRNPQVLVMDEATSALDAATERGIMDTLTGLRSEKTIVMIAHRLSTIQAADIVILIDSGRVLDSGTYAELQARSDLFRRIVLASEAEPAHGAPHSDE